VKNYWKASVPDAHLAAKKFCEQRCTVFERWYVER
jgi:hypothetical protein